VIAEGSRERRVFQSQGLPGLQPLSMSQLRTLRVAMPGDARGCNGGQVLRSIR